MVENETVFREYNESIEKGFDEIERIAKEEGQEDILGNRDMPLYFYCECSDENCDTRLLLKPSQYSKIHKRRDRFVIVAGHETKTIEKIIEKRANYYIVEKFAIPPKSKHGLNKTDIDNS